MRQRVLAGAAALVVVVGLIALAVVGSGGDGPRPLPIGAAGAAPEGERAAMSDMALMAPTEYRVVGELPELDGEERAWSVGREADEAGIASLARALGLDGDVEVAEHGWRVVDGDAALEVSRQPGLPWWYGQHAGTLEPDTPVSSLPMVDPDDGGARDEPAHGEVVDCPMPECPPGTACIQACPDDGSAVRETRVEPLPEPERPDGLPSRAEAEAVGREVMTGAGLDLERADLRTEDLFSSWLVSARPEVGGLPTVGMDWGVTVGVDGAVEHANGWLADPVEGDSYPLIGTTAAIERLREGQGGDLMARPEPAIHCVDCPEPEPVVVTITGARVGLQLVHAYDVDEAWLVPTYLLATDGGEEGVVNELWVLALGDEHIAQPPVPELPEGCELIGGDAVVCDDDGGGVSGRPGQSEPGSPGEPQSVEPAEPQPELVEPDADAG